MTIHDAIGYLTVGVLAVWLAIGIRCLISGTVIRYENAQIEVNNSMVKMEQVNSFTNNVKEAQ